jgi:hypothetical protein
MQQLFGRYEIRYLGTETPRFSSSNAALDRFRGPEFVVFELPLGEPDGLSLNARGFQAKAGFYQIDVTIDQCEATLSASQL